MAQELGMGWVAAPDPSSGRTYYANTVTGATTWEYPAELLDAQNAAAAAAAVTATTAAAVEDTSAVVPAPAPVPVDVSGLPEGWVGAQDPSSGRMYYVYLPTGATQWEPPVAPTPAPEAAHEVTGNSDASSAAATQPAYTPVVAAPAPAPAPANPATGKHAALWRQILDYARTEATSRIQAKNKKFAGLRNFAEIAARKKKEAAAKKALEAEAEIAETKAVEAAAAVEAVRFKRPLLAMLDIPDTEIPSAAVPRPIEEYAEEAFELNRKGMFHRKTTVDKVLAWKNEVIKTALLKMPSKELEGQAIQCFRNITGFMGDRETGKEDTGHADKLLKICLHSPAELRDEVFCQLIKQTTKNPSPESTVKGWQLMAIVAGSIAPSPDFRPYLISFCQSAMASGGQLGDYAKYALGRLAKTISLGPRREVPTSMEIEASRNREPVLVRVYHLDGTFDTVPVTSWVVPSLLKAMVAEKRGIRNPEAFAIYEMTPDGEERFLEADERVLDLVAYWQRLYEEEKQKGEDGASKKKKKKAIGNDFYRVVFKVHMYLDPAPNDPAAAHEMYVQAAYDVVSARYPCGEKDCLALGALQMQAEYGKTGVQELETKLTRYIPGKFLENPIHHAPLAAELGRQHAAHADKSKQDAESEYLAYVRDWQVYGSSFFFVEPQMSLDLPEEVFLAVNPKGILIIDPDSKKVLGSYPYSEVPTWGHSGTSFVLHVGNLIKQTKLYFATEQGKEINDLVRSYVNFLVLAM